MKFRTLKCIVCGRKASYFDEGFSVVRRKAVEDGWYFVKISDELKPICSYKCKKEFDHGNLDNQQM